MSGRGGFSKQRRGNVGWCPSLSSASCLGAKTGGGNRDGGVWWCGLSQGPLCVRGGLSKSTKRECRVVCPSILASCLGATTRGANPDRGGLVGAAYHRGPLCVRADFLNQRKGNVGWCTSSFPSPCHGPTKVGVATLTVMQGFGGGVYHRVLCVCRVDFINQRRGNVGWCIAAILYPCLGATARGGRADVGVWWCAMPGHVARRAGKTQTAPDA